MKNQPQRCLDPIDFTVDSVPSKPVTKDATGECEKAAQTAPPRNRGFCSREKLLSFRLLSRMKILKKHMEAMEPSSEAHSA